MTHIVVVAGGARTMVNGGYSHLADKVGIDAGLHFWRYSVALTLCSDGTYQERHVSAQHLHDLHAFLVLHHLFGCVAVHFIPVSARDDGHL